MVDYVNIKVIAGDGGDGHVSFLRQKGKPFGIPEGGDGGDGGDVFIVPSKDLNTLAPYRYKKDFQAFQGEHGGRNNKTGAKAADLLLEVPLGTLIKDEKGELIYDLTQPTEKIMVAKGGEGGRGNIHLRHVIRERQNAGVRGFIKVGENGFPGESISLTLELKLLADVGLVGLPNAGKSTLISKLTSAKPKIADYPFTTLEPNLGVLTIDRKEIVIADIPGLIEGASSGKGLGDQFLRHVERTRLLLHLVSLDSTAPLEDYLTINKELSSYSEKLKEIPQIVLLTKSDLVGEEKVKEVLAQFKKKKLKTMVISSVAGLGLEELKKELVKKIG
ncbi:MAG TPA: GTPase ObgE [Candidatus Saccharimonadales bacterium]|nr:GTPase ObgE [Candidatus Saccharimonadales bacterium]